MDPCNTRLQLHELHYNLGWIWQQQANFKQASESYRKAILLSRQAIQGEQMTSAAPSQFASAAAYQNLSVVLAEQGQWQAAVYYARRAIALQPNLVPAYSSLGMALLQQSQIPAAIEVFQRALTLQQQGVSAADSTWANLYYNLGQALQYQIQIQPALDPTQEQVLQPPIAAYRQALTFAPDNAQIHYQLGMALQQQGNHREAIAAFQQALALDPLRLDIAADCGFSWLTLGDSEQAVCYLRRSIAADSPFITAYCRALSPLEDETELDEMMQAKLAFSQFLTALQDDSSLGQIKHYLAESLLHWSNVLAQYGGSQQLRQAALHYQQAMQLQPQWINIYLGLANCLMQQGQTAAAMAVYDQLQVRLDRDRLTQDRPHSLEPEPINRVPVSTESQSPTVVQLLEQAQQWQQAIAYYRGSLQRGSLQQGQSSPVVETALACQQSIAATTDPVSAGLDPLDEAHTTPLRICEGLNCHPCLKRVTNWFNPVPLAPGIARLHPPAVPLSPETTAPLPVAILPQGYAWAASKENAWKVCNAIAVFTGEGQLLAQYSRDYPGELPECQYPSTLFRIPSSANLGVPKQISGRVANLTGLSGDVYFHWMVDVLPRLEILRQNGFDLQEIDWFLVNSKQKDFQQETLQALGIPLERVIESDRFPYIQAEELIVPAFTGDLGWVQPWVINLWRDHFLSKIDHYFCQNHANSAYSGEHICATGQVDNFVARSMRQENSTCPRRIYISRTDAQYRRLLNEDALIELLLSFDFTVLTLEQLTVLEQAQLFSQANWIVAPHGSSLTNLVFCQPGTKVLELVSPNYVRHYYWPISQHLQLEHYLVWGQDFSCTALRQLMYPSPLTEDIWIDIDRLQQALQFSFAS